MKDQQAAPKEIAFVVYPGLTPLDLFGPLEVMVGMTLFNPDYRCVSVGEAAEPLETGTPISVVPHRTFADVPAPYALIVPGGGAPTMKALADEVLISYVRSAASRAEIVCSVCTGALILAQAGLLEGRNATTHWAFAKQLERLGGRYIPERWVESGNVLTSAGITAGIDMALHLVSRLAGEAVARQVQLLIEYDPQPPLGGIAWEELDRDMLDPVVNGWINEGLAAEPALARKLIGGA